MKVPLPCPLAQWQCETFEEWEDQAMLNRRVGLREALTAILDTHQLSDDVSDYTALILVHGLLGVRFVAAQQSWNDICTDIDIQL